ncbi:MAG TPA: hypothetical protein VIN73_13020 [Vicingaceae bacterium]
MNIYSQNISTWLQDPSLFTQANAHLVNAPDHQFNVHSIPVRLNDSINTCEYLKELILQAINEELFEELPVTNQTQIHNQVQALFTNRNDVNKFITQTDSLYYNVILSGLESRIKNYSTFKNSLKDIAGLRRSYQAQLKGLDKLKKQVSQIESNFNKSIELINSFDEKKGLIESELATSQNNLTSINQIYEQLNQAKQEIENSKKEVLAFKSNIDSYKTDIDDKSESAKKIIDEFDSKRVQVDKLIEESEQALGLKATEGMSAALNIQYTEEKDTKKRKQWLITAIVFLLISLFGTALLILKFDLNGKEISADSVNGIIARIVFVGIAITGATFASKQYLKQKRLADDYAYKLVLAKSIVAFAREIKKYSPEKASEYLTDVLKEINRSPIHFTHDDTSSITDKQVSIIEKIVKAFNKGN